MPQFDRVFRARLGTNTSVKKQDSHAIWVRAVQSDEDDEALIHIAQLPNDVYLSPADTREYAAYLINLANKMDGGVRLESIADTGPIGFIDVKPHESSDHADPSL